MEMQVYFVVQPFRRKGGRLVPDEARPMPSEDAARRMVERLAASGAGGIAFSRRANFDFGIYEDAKVILSAGAILSEVEEALVA